MARCSFCGKEIDGLPYNCHRCNGSYCSNHRLLEDHNCPGLEREKAKNQERWASALRDYPMENKKKQRLTNNYRKLNPLKKWYRKIGYWLNYTGERRYRYSRLESYIVPLIIKLIVSLIIAIVLYSNLNRLNEIKFWIIKLGSSLFILNLFFLIKYSFKILNEIWNWIKRQRNQLKYLIIIIFLSLLWQSYVNRTTILNPFFDYYNKTNFSMFSPLRLGNFTLDKERISFNYEDTTSKKAVIIPLMTKARGDLQQVENKIHDLINQKRANSDLSLLSLDNKLSNIARAHSQDMINRNFFSHFTPEGKDPSERASKAGYSCYKDFGSYYMVGVAENIALTPIGDVVGCGEVYSEDDIAKCTVDGWMDSPGHRQNILTSHFDKEGIGVAISSNNEIYVTQDFC